MGCQKLSLPPLSLDFLANSYLDVPALAANEISALQRQGLLLPALCFSGNKFGGYKMVCARGNKPLEGQGWVVWQASTIGKVDFVARHSNAGFGNGIGINANDVGMGDV